MTATFIKRRGTIAVVEARAEVDGKLAASGTLTLPVGNENDCSAEEETLMFKKS